MTKARHSSPECWAFSLSIANCPAMKFLFTSQPNITDIDLKRDCLMPFINTLES
jgi:hypothetical protein